MPRSEASAHSVRARSVLHSAADGTKVEPQWDAACSCPVCASRRLFDWGRRNGYSLYRCGQCSHRFADVGEHGVLHESSDVFRARLTHDLMKSDADYYRHLCFGEREGGATFETTRRILHQLDRLDLPQVRDWLDIGCGSGHLLRETMKRGWRAIGVEPGGWGQIAAREKGVCVRQGFLDRQTLSTRFGCISAADVLEHQPDPRELIALIDFYLVANGFAFLSVPYADSFHGRIVRHRWAMVEPPTHCQFFTRRSIRALVVGSELTVHEILQFNLSYPPLVGRIALGRNICDWLLRATLGGDQALIVLRKRSGR